jgi:tRNA A58 N-methylase Trm61
MVPSGARQRSNASVAEAGIGSGAAAASMVAKVAERNGILLPWILLLWIRVLL